MAIFNTNYINNETKTKYTDGKTIEYEMLERVRSGETNIRENDSWPLIYHFSKFRENILNWYPFKKECTILEIGSGCGAITGLFCRKAKHVTSIELEYDRAIINYERHKNYNNLEIIVGDFNNIELKEKYDYVILNGVLEYSSYIMDSKSDDPFADLLIKAKKNLKKSGTILIAIENKLGLKYFSGSKEDHLGIPFAGLNGYKDSKIRTFSKYELEQLCNKANCKIKKWYYPYPDYKFPFEIFTDESINKRIPLSTNLPIDSEQFQIFDELKVHESMMKNSIANIFANSFLVEISDCVSNDIDYVKISNNRKNKFSICTYLNYKEKSVYKTYIDLEAKEHINSISKNKFNSNIIKTIDSKKINGIIYFNLLDYKCIKEIIFDENNCVNLKALLEALEVLKNDLYSISKENKRISKKFEQVFGLTDFKEKLHWIKNPNIDLTIENLFIKNKKHWVLIDPEWEFDFEMPAEYILWRTIFYLPNTELFNREETSKTCSFLGINKKTYNTFYNMEIYFTLNYVGALTNNIYKSIKQVDINVILNNNKSLTSENSNLLTSNDILNKKNNELLVEQAKFENDNRKLTKVNDDLNSLINELSISNDILNKKNNELLVEQTKFENNNKTLTKINDSLNSRINELSMDNCILNNKNNELLTELSKYIDNNETLTKVNGELNDQISKLSISNENIVKRNKKLLEEQVKFINNNEALTKLNNELNSKINELSIQNENLIKKNNELLEKQTKFINNNKALTTVNVELNNQVNETSKKIVELDNKYKNIELQFNSILDSKFWKLTKPFRVLTDKIKKTQIFCFIRYLKAYGINKTCYRVLFRLHIFNNDKNFNNIEELCRFLRINDYEYFGYDSSSNKIYKKSKRRILFITHALDLTGAPNALLKFAQARKALGEYVAFLSPSDGEMKKELINSDIPLIIYKELNNDNFVARISKLYSLIVVNTTENHHSINVLNNTETPVIWWIHEAAVSYHERTINGLPGELNDNVKVFCVSDYAKAQLLKYRPNYKPNSLLYYSNDFSLFNNSSSFQFEKDSKKLFVMVGMQEKRKRQDIFVDAILLLKEEDINKCLFVFVGKDNYIPYKNKIDTVKRKYPNNVFVFDKLLPNDLSVLYKQMDFMVCCSDDDPLPMVVAEAMSLGKPTICSKDIGQAKMIEETKSGVVLSKNNSKELAQNIIKIINNNLNHFTSSNIRKIYLKNFSHDVFINSTNKIIENIEKSYFSHQRPKISVIIPTYNGEKTLEKLLYKIRNQINKKDIEIIAIDSGSTDNTIDILHKYKVKITEINNASFTHSFARNLGYEKSCGNILLFMTQDAIPSSNDWVLKMTDPIIKKEVVAVCCKEQCPSNIDLYYKCASYYHSNYIGYDKVSYYSESYNTDELRKNANLNDVATAVSRDIFSMFKYRYDFAEDLDLGIRLIKSGYRIKFISNPVILHGHNRNIDYYFRRSLAEGANLPKILGYASKKTRDSELADLYWNYHLLQNVEDKILSSSCTNINEIVKVFNNYIENEKENIYIKNVAREQPILSKVFNVIQESCVLCKDINFSPIYDMKYYLEAVLKEYIESFNVNYTKEEILNCMDKQFAALVGIAMSNIENKKIMAYIDTLKKGI